jgi:hypothetical protein
MVLEKSLSYPGAREERGTRDSEDNQTEKVNIEETTNHG